MNLKKAQVWVETAIYTLIGLTIIAILLTTATPQIEKIKDKGIISQTAEALDILNNKFYEISLSAGNSRIIEFTVAKGRVEIDTSKNLIQYVMEDTRFKLSEPGQVIKEGDITILTKERGARFDIYLTLNYTDKFDLTFNNQERVEILQAGTTPYKIQIENVGDSPLIENPHIDINLL